MIRRSSSPSSTTTRFFWGVPDYVPADLVRSVEDLAKPEVAGRMERTIQGIGPGAGITVFSLQMMKAYGLEQAGYTFRTGTTADWVGAFERGVAERRCGGPTDVATSISQSSVQYPPSRRTEGPARHP